MRAKLEQMKGKRDMLQSKLLDYNKNLIQSSQDYLECEQAQSILQTVGQATQQKVKQFIEDLVTMAIESVFDNPYKFEIDFVIKRGATEGELYFVRDNQRIKPLDASGGGVVDLVSFVLRICLLTLKVGKKSDVIILDEPMKFISRNYIPMACELLKKLSNDLNYQFILITHIPELVDYADRVFQVVDLGKIKEV